MEEDINEDSSLNPSTTKKRGKGVGMSLLIGTSIALLGGFVVAKKPEVELVSSKHKNPTRFALRALGWATFLTVAGAGAIGGAVCWYLDVWNIPEFSTKMRQVVPPIFQAIDNRFPKTVLRYQFGILKPKKSEIQVPSDSEYESKLE